MYLTLYAISLTSFLEEMSASQCYFSDQVNTACIVLRMYLSPSRIPLTNLGTDDAFSPYFALVLPKMYVICYTGLKKTVTILSRHSPANWLVPLVLKSSSSPSKSSKLLPKSREALLDEVDFFCEN